MKAFFSINAGLITLAMFSAAQENIPDAAPIADGPLVANPELDTLDMAAMLQAGPGSGYEGEPAGIWTPS